MHIRRVLIPRFLVLVGALGAAAGCPGKEEGDPTGNGETGGESTVSGAPGTGTEPATESDAVPTSETGDTTAEPATETTAATTSTGETTSEPSTGEPDGVCDCIDVSEFGNGSFTCGSGSCGVIAPDCVDAGDTDTDTDTDGWGDCELSVDDAQIDCALDLLIAGESGEIIKWVYSPDFGFSSDGGFVQILPERQGLTRTWYWVDLSGEDSAAGVVALRPANYFEGCKALPTGAERFACLRDWSEQEPAAQCDESGYASDI